MSPPPPGSPGRPGCRHRARRAERPSAARSERVVDGGAEVLEGMRAHERLAVDEEGGRAAHAELAPLREVRLHGGAERVVVEAALEALAVEIEVDGVADEVVALEARLPLEQHVVIGPVAALLAGAARGLVGGHGQRVRGQREVLVDQTHAAVVLLEHLLQRPLDAPAERSLVIGELHDGDGCRRRAFDHLRLDGEAVVRARRGRAAAHSERGHPEAEPERDGVDSPRRSGDREPQAHDGGGYHMPAALDAVLGTYPSWSHLVVRLALGVVFFAHGSQKVLGWFGGHGLAGTGPGYEFNFVLIAMALSILIGGAGVLSIDRALWLALAGK